MDVVEPLDGAASVLGVSADLLARQDLEQLDQRMLLTPYRARSCQCPRCDLVCMQQSRNDSLLERAIDLSIARRRKRTPSEKSLPKLLTCKPRWLRR